ncbi:RHS repeat domain-containing protein [Lusitaniella coriacea]|uniref:RHS repeat domain-containing protein n=1 Tax=Lusitaniella coriacea TaxID=1983105 RepID=UPI003CE86E69
MRIANCFDGQVASITDERGTTAFDYDAQGRLIARRDPTGPYVNDNSIEYAYDDSGNITQVRTAAGVATYTYDEQNRLETVTEDNETTTYLYDLAGNLKETQFPNGVIERRTYDELNRLDVLETEKDGTLLSRFDYATNDAGHRLEVIESVRQPDGTLAERTVKYEYDDLYRLISEEVVGGDTTTYTYDDVGNRLSKTVNGVITNTYTYDDNDLLEVEVSGGDTIEYKYDKNGNLTERKENGVVAATYVWDDQNRMVQAQTDAGTVTYAYDDDNIRVSETTASGTKSYVLDKNRPYAQVLAEYEGDTEVASYTYGLDLIEQERDGSESYYQVDGLGSTRGLTDENGNVTDTYSYDAYGNVVGVAGTTENDYRFAGEQFDGTLGQYYLRQRYYDASTGRFTRRDTYEGRLSDPVSLHKYLYANADPVNGIDPSGLFTMAEVSAARSIRNTLAEAQFNSYLGLAKNVDPDGVGGKVTGFIDKIISTVEGIQLITSLKGLFVIGATSFGSNGGKKLIKFFASAGNANSKVFGHSFSTHGEKAAKNIKNLASRAISKEIRAVGAWKNNKKGAVLLEQIYNQIGVPSKKTVVKLRKEILDELGIVVDQAGNPLEASHVLLVPSPSHDFVRVSYPIDRIKVTEEVGKGTSLVDLSNIL